MKDITLKNVTACSSKQQMALLELRNHQDVRSYMLTDHEIGVNEHLIWISSLVDDRAREAYIVCEGEEVLGLLSFSQLSNVHKTASLGIYVDPAIGGGLGSALLVFGLHDFFERRAFEKLNAEVVAGNEVAMHLYRKCGFEEEGRQHNQIIKKNARQDMVLFGINKSQWEQKKDSVSNSLNDKAKGYNVSFSDEKESEWNQVLSEIRDARARNNVNWMALLKLAIEGDSDIAKQTLDEILQTDKEISGMTERLVKATGSTKH